MNLITGLLLLPIRIRNPLIPASKSDVLLLHHTKKEKKTQLYPQLSQNFLRIQMAKGVWHNDNPHFK